MRLAVPAKVFACILIICCEASGQDGPTRRQDAKIVHLNLDSVEGAGSEQTRRRPRYWPQLARKEWPIHDDILPVESLEGEGVWIDPSLEKVSRSSAVTVWFDRQFLGDGQAFVRRSQEFSGHRRKVLAKRVVETLKTIGEQSYRDAEESMRKLVEDKKVFSVKWHWIVNGFTCQATREGIDALEDVPGVSKIFKARLSFPGRATRRDLQPEFFPSGEIAEFDPEHYKHPWYTRYLLAEKVWKELGISGQGTLNVVMDSSFQFSRNVTTNLYRNPREVPGNGKDDDKNGLIDDYHGYNFTRHDALLTTQPDSDHGFICAAEICGTGTEECPYEFGLAPSAKWAAVIRNYRGPESAIEWAIEQGADTLSMSFSIPDAGECRSHWRKIMEQATFCGLFSVSGAGNSGRKGSSKYAPVPLQMRIPEDIPLAVFAPAGVKRTFERPKFSSQGPVKWETEHYREGLVDKPDFCAFNSGLPKLLTNGKTEPSSANGNSFAGPMMAGTLSLMLSADPDLLPWDARQVLVETATDVGPEGFDHQTGNGLLNCYRAVREVLRRKCLRNGDDPTQYEGREEGDTLDIAIGPIIQEPVFE